MEQLDTIKELISQGEVEQAIDSLNSFLSVPAKGGTTDDANRAEAYYLYGNAYRKQGNWQQALNNYTKAIDLIPDSPASEARRALLDILEFFNKDMYNQ